MGRIIRNTFPLHHDFYSAIKMLSMEQRGVLFTAIYAYKLGEELPPMDMVTERLYNYIQSWMDDSNAVMFREHWAHRIQMDLLGLL